MLSFLAESYLHGLDPFAIQFTETYGLRWYGLSYAAGFLIAWWLIRWMAVTGRTPITPARAGDLMFYIIVGVLVGGRVGYAIFYDPALFIGVSSSVPFWDLIAINKGGMASHGGMLGVIGACVVYARRTRISALHLLDVTVLVGTPGLGLGRLANFVNAELHGRAIPDQADPPWWSMKFPKELYEWPIARLTELTGVVNDTLAITPREWEQLVTAASAGDTRAHDTVQGVLGQLVKLVQAGDEPVREALRPLLTAFYPSQLIQALAEGPLLFACLALLWLRPRKPGIIGSWFLVVYGVFRILTEFVREPDQGVALIAGLSRGQLLSVLMIVAGVVTMPICALRNVEPMGGLLRK